MREFSDVADEERPERSNRRSPTIDLCDQLVKPHKKQWCMKGCGKADRNTIIELLMITKEEEKVTYWGCIEC